MTILSEKLVESGANTEGIRVFHWADPQWKNNYQSTKETKYKLKSQRIKFSLFNLHSNSYLPKFSKGSVQTKEKGKNKYQIR